MKRIFLTTAALITLYGCTPAKVAVGINPGTNFEDVYKGDQGYKYYPLEPHKVTTRQHFTLAREPIYLDLPQLKLGKAEDYAKKVCVPEDKVELRMLPSSKARYIRMKMPRFGKGSGAITFDEAGNLRNVAVGSDTTAVPAAIADIATTAIPYYAALKAFEGVLEPINAVTGIPKDLLDAIGGMSNLTEEKAGSSSADPFLKYQLKEYAVDLKLGAELLKVKYCVPGKVDQIIVKRAT